MNLHGTWRAAGTATNGLEYHGATRGGSG